MRKRLAGVTSDADAEARRKQDYIEQLEAANAELRAQWQATTPQQGEAGAPASMVNLTSGIVAFLLLLLLPLVMLLSGGRRSRRPVSTS